MASAPVQVHVGQVWRERDSRFRDRCVTVARVTGQGDGEFAHCATGHSHPRETRIRVGNLRRRWRLVSEPGR